MTPDVGAAPRTPKGARTAARILDAATTVLDRDGFGGVTLGRVADEAGMDKRSVLYHFGSRGALLLRVVGTVGDRLAASIAADVDAARGADPADAFVAAIWDAARSDQPTIRAYFALVGGGAESAEVQGALRDLNDGYERLVVDLVQRADGAGAGPPSEAQRRRGALVVLVLRGMLLELIERGEGPGTADGLELLRAIIRDEAPACISHRSG